uniref:Pseudouridine synthase RsuA/RluA-like domain-containing protein n=1 Tax=Attheya septentrionalis TaxID=420275 RepID=A0A7S2UIM7_9STRA|mmetsp:Transcript_27161/g.49391  ORF Transcript_27161/g.49391 Transcript_27161/m.49391 type:complete len:424 (+) Transcript_27161:147-1418(+)|eukprot:CAMPEP_0198298940 /NCGR_PEP_ID=MMETSP1449-20131203/42761_1 /TAXON_ID=420275 /ORGANISM="Attheya septentrionalis, Strain CCMP2084" /LENGTH=423 /DNA_ID=CAMNT_0044000341 /DNA_START=68 /DNA_END=1339 /DNA_ORIENTATION=+
MRGSTILLCLASSCTVRQQIQPLSLCFPRRWDPRWTRTGNRKRQRSVRFLSFDPLVNPGKSNFQQTPWDYRYTIVHSHVVKEEGATLRDVLSVHSGFDFASKSQARNACRLGSIVVVLGRNNSLTATRNISLDPISFDSESQCVIQNRTMIAAESMQVSLKKDDIVAQITRIDSNKFCYQVCLTRHIQPPKLSDDCHIQPTVVYQDDDMAVVHKPEGLTTIEGGKDSRSDLESMLPFFLRPPQTPVNRHISYLPRPVHRLDRATSGLVLVAKTKQSASHLSQEFAKRRIRKTYTALVFGHVKDNDGVVDYPMDGKAAVSRWRVLQRSNHSKHNMTMLQVEPLTGRMHQIRRHLSYCLEAPIVGDGKYDNGQENKPFRCFGLFLCATSISFVHPTTKETCFFSIPIPQKFEDMLADIMEVDIAS